MLVYAQPNTGYSQVLNKLAIHGMIDVRPRLTIPRKSWSERSEIEAKYMTSGEANDDAPCMRQRRHRTMETCMAANRRNPVPMIDPTLHSCAAGSTRTRRQSN
jgi:hypothetical protein